MKRTRHNFEIELDYNGIPEDDKKSNGGRMPDTANYGSWLRMYDPGMFELAYHKWNPDWNKGWE